MQQNVKIRDKNNSNSKNKFAESNCGNGGKDGFDENSESEIDNKVKTMNIKEKCTLKKEEYKKSCQEVLKIKNKNVSVNINNLNMLNLIKNYKTNGRNSTNFTQNYSSLLNQENNNLK